MSKELRRRTGVDSKIIELVLRNYHDIIRETLQHGVEYSLPDIGVITNRPDIALSISIDHPIIHTVWI